MSQPDVLDSAEAGATALRGGAMRAGGYALGLLVTLISTPILLHHLGVRGFGEYTSVMALIGLVGTGAEAGLLAIALREYTTHEGAARRHLMRQLLGMRVVVTVSGVLIATLFALAVGYRDIQVLGVLAAGTGLLFTMVQALFTVPLQTTMRFGRATALDLLRQVLAAGGVIGLVLAGATLGWFFLVPAFAGGVMLLATVAVVRDSVPKLPILAPRAWGALLHDTLPFAVATAIYAAYFRVAIIVMSVGASRLETGFFATSYRVVEVLIAMPAIAVTAAFPVLVRAERNDHARFERATLRMIELALTAGVFTATALVLAAPLIIDLLTPPEGHPAITVLRLQAPAMIATFVSVTCMFALLALRRQMRILVANTIAFGASVVLSVILVATSAADGAALATTIAEFLLAGTIFVLLRRDMPSIAGIVRSVPALVLATGGALAVLAIPGLGPAGDTALGLAIFAGVLAALGRIPPEVGRALRFARVARR